MAVKKTVKEVAKKVVRKEEPVTRKKLDKLERMKVAHDLAKSPKK